jgi:hypothetical protein
MQLTQVRQVVTGVYQGVARPLAMAAGNSETPTALSTATFPSSVMGLRELLLDKDCDAVAAEPEACGTCTVSADPAACLQCLGSDFCSCRCSFCRGHTSAIERDDCFKQAANSSAEWLIRQGATRGCRAADDDADADHGDICSVSDGIDGVSGCGSYRSRGWEGANVGGIRAAQAEAGAVAGVRGAPSVAALPGGAPPCGAPSLRQRANRPHAAPVACIADGPHRRRVLFHPTAGHADWLLDTAWQVGHQPWGECWLVGITWPGGQRVSGPILTQRAAC